MSKILFPSEIKVWFVLPAIRKELSKSLIKKGLSQRKVSEILGITESAVSQYLKDKRGNDIKLTKEIKQLIEKSADEIINNQSSSTKELIMLMNNNLVSNLICKYHKTHDPRIKKNCNICFKKGEMSI